MLKATDKFGYDLMTELEASFALLRKWQAFAQRAQITDLDLLVEMQELEAQSAEATKPRETLKEKQKRLGFNV